MTKLTIDLCDALTEQLGSTMHIPATIDISEVFEFTEAHDHEFDLDELLARDRKVALVFGAGDVLARRSGLTDEEAWEVARRVRDDLETSLTDFIGDGADHLFPSARRTLDARMAALKFDLSKDGSDDALTLLTEMDGIRRVLGHMRDDDPGLIGRLAAAIDDIETAAKALPSAKTGG